MYFIDRFIHRLHDVEAIEDIDRTRDFLCQHCHRVNLRWRMTQGEDKAPWRHDLSAYPETNTEEGRQEAALCFTFGIGIQSAKSLLLVPFSTISLSGLSRNWNVAPVGLR